MAYCTMKQICREHEINFKRLDNDSFKAVLETAVKYPLVVSRVKSLLHLYPIELDQYLNDLLDNGLIVQYELAKALIPIYL